MKLSDMPELKKRRDEMARGLHRRRGGNYLDAVKEANAAVLRGYRQAVTETAPKPAKKGGRRKAREARIREAVQQAISRVATEAAKGTLASGQVQDAAADSRPLHELSDDELTDRVAEEVLRSARPQPVTESGPEPSATEPAGLPEKPLHELDFEAWEQHFGDVMVAHAEQSLVSPFGQGARAVRSPFMQGLLDD
jgi:hypothetical protein